MMPIVLTPAAGKRLIARAVARHRAVTDALVSGTVVIVAGTTNGYVAEEILKRLGHDAVFDRARFFRGVTLPPSCKTTESGRLPDESRFPGDVIIVKGEWQRGETVFDVADDLKEGDVVLKGANAVNLRMRQAAVLIGHPKAGTLLSVMQAAVGRWLQPVRRGFEPAPDCSHSRGARRPARWRFLPLQAPGIVRRTPPQSPP